jgi:hypothetical protein
LALRLDSEKHLSGWKFQSHVEIKHGAQIVESEGEFRRQKFRGKPVLAYPASQEVWE